ncbi:hypothetical protein BJX66DRAFT_338637 [Aspergillus keveii]|uniref:Uncharacterized protein n=1 Tax=Aspergillus keveii TaxID=714993 RepID=A0ABR4G3K6_9EURO
MVGSIIKPEPNPSPPNNSTGYEPSSGSEFKDEGCSGHSEVGIKERRHELTSSRIRLLRHKPEDVASTGASAIIQTEIWWDVNQEAQAYCRAYRHGQTRKKALAEIEEQDNVLMAVAMGKPAY